jgi:hypothetical protein
MVLLTISFFIRMTFATTFKIKSKHLYSSNNIKRFIHIRADDDADDEDSWCNNSGLHKDR